MNTIKIMWWASFFLRLSAVQAFLTKTASPLVVGSSHSFSATNARKLPMRQAPAFGRLRMADCVAVPETNTTDSTEGIASRTPNERGTVILADADEFIKPDRDTRDYRIVKLKNNLQALIVSTAKAASSDDEDEDESARVEAASMHIQAGHFDDTLPGLAHFYEHLLFLGTEKYPEEEEYERFLSRYGGFGNAYT